MAAVSKHAHRWPCSVPGCRRTIGANAPYDPAHCWALCSKHWPTVPPKMKAIRRRAQRRVDKTWRAVHDGSTHHPLYEAHRRAFHAMLRLDKRIVRYACERALGIG